MSTQQDSEAQSSTAEAGSIFEKLGLVRRKRVESARQTFNRLVHAVALGENLSARDIEALADSMKSLNLADRDLQASIDAIQRQTAMPEAQAAFARAERDLAKSRKDIETHTPIALAAAAKQASLQNAATDAEGSLRSAQAQVKNLENHRDSHRELFE